MSMRNGSIVLVSVALYAIGLYGLWQVVSAGTFHWTLAAFPCALLGLGLVPFLRRRPVPATTPEVFDEDRTE